MELKQIIAARIKEAREAAGLTQAELADELGVARSLVSEIESGASWIHVRRLAKVKEVLDKSADWFIGGGTDKLSDDQLRLLEAYNSIGDESLKELVIDIALLLAGKSPRKRKRK